MKERIIIDKEKVIAFRPKGLDVYSQEYVEEIDVIENTKKVEQVPETWEELKELCKKENISKCEDEIKIKWHNNTSLYFYEKDGEIICKDGDSCIEMTIGYDRTPAQMWQIIKNLMEK